jgi:hypothetical protein
VKGCVGGGMALFPLANPTSLETLRARSSTNYEMDTDP